MTPTTLTYRVLVDRQRGGKTATETLREYPTPEEAAAFRDGYNAARRTVYGRTAAYVEGKA